MHFAGRPMPGQQDPFVWECDVPVVKDAIAHFACDSYAEHAAGDHTLHIGQVRDLRQHSRIECTARLMLCIGLDRRMGKDSPPRRIVKEVLGVARAGAVRVIRSQRQRCAGPLVGCSGRCRRGNQHVSGMCLFTIRPSGRAMAQRQLRQW